MSKLLLAALLGSTTIVGVIGLQDLLTALGYGSALNLSGQGQQSISVPEPSFGSMALVGLGVLMLLRRRKQ